MCPSVQNVPDVGGCVEGPLGNSCGIVLSSAWTLSIKERKDRLDITVCFDLFSEDLEICYWN